MRVCVCVCVYQSDLLKLRWVVLRDLAGVLGTEFRQSHWMLLITQQFLWLIFIFFFCGIHLYIFMGYNNVLVHMHVEYLVKITAMSHQYVSHLKLSISCFQTVVWWVCFILQNRNFRSLGSSPFPPFPVLAATFFFYEAGYYYSSCKWAHTISVLSCVVF